MARNLQDAPLRKIIGTVEWTYAGVKHRPVTRDVLECLHTCGDRSDIYGPTSAYRRRCDKCRDGKLPEVRQDHDGTYHQLNSNTSAEGR